MKYRIEFELPDNDTVLRNIKTADVGWAIWGYNGYTKAKPVQEWIPCEERLPEKDTCFYLATIANHGLNFTTTLPDDVDVVRWDYDRRKGHNSWHWCTERTVIAWMPLPEPYAERTVKSNADVNT